MIKGLESEEYYIKQMEHKTSLLNSLDKQINILENNKTKINKEIGLIYEIIQHLKRC